MGVPEKLAARKDDAVGNTRSFRAVSHHEVKQLARINQVNEHDLSSMMDWCVSGIDDA